MYPSPFSDYEAHYSHLVPLKLKTTKELPLLFEISDKNCTFKKNKSVEVNKSMKHCKIKGQVFTLLASNGNEQIVLTLQEELHQSSQLGGLT